MLVLTRKINETITLGHPASVEPLIQVTVVEVRGDQVRPGTTGLRFIFVQLLSARLIGTSLLKVSKWNKMLVTCEGYDDFQAMFYFLGHIFPKQLQRLIVYLI